MWRQLVKLDLKKFEKHLQKFNSELLELVELQDSCNLTLRCNIDDNIWSASLRTMRSRAKRNVWCLVCSKAKINQKKLRELQEIAKEKGGMLLSSEFTYSKNLLLWQCNENHKWESPSYVIKRGSWCPVCARFKQSSINMDVIKEKAIFMGGHCLNDKYMGWDFKYKWKCKFNHIFTSTAQKVLSEARWCPRCKPFSIAEEICRSYFEQMFEKKFPKSYPRWLVSNTNAQLELDGYCEELGVAFEHNGAQHYRLSKFAKTEKEFQKILKHDEIKKKLCEENRVSLFIIPELRYKTKVANLKTLICKLSDEFNINIPSKDVEISLKEVFTPRSYKSFKRLSDIAIKRNGKLISENYLGNESPHTWYCNEHNHYWESWPRNIKKGAWCPICKGILNDGEKYLTEIELKNKGKCLSLLDPEFVYKNNKTKLLWRCELGHEFWKSPSNAKIRFCKECRKLCKSSCN